VEPDLVSRPKRERGVLLSTLPAGAGQRRLALTVVAVSAVFFAIAAPLAQRPLTPVAAFIPIYESALVINDLITAALLPPCWCSHSASGSGAMASTA